VVTDQHDQLLGQFKVGGVESDVVAHVDELVELCPCRLDDPGVVVADVGHTDSTGHVENLPAVCRPDIGADSTLDHQVGTASGCRRKEAGSALCGRQGAIGNYCVLHNGLTICE